LPNAKQNLVLDLLGIAMSKNGLRTVTSYQRKNNGNGWANLDNYMITFFGKPSHVESWGWRFEGWHVSLHFTIVPTQCDIMIMPLPV
jgi:hypothetical protein